MSKHSKDDVTGTVMEPVRAAKSTKKRTLEVTVFPKEGGRPVVVTVEPDASGYFKINKDHPGEYKVQRGSVWEEGGKLRAIVNEGNPQTVNAYTLTGEDTFDPVALHGVASNNLWEQLDKINRAKSAWKQLSTWGFMTLGVILILVLVWNVSTIGGGLEDLRAAMESMGTGTATGGGEAGTGGGSAGSGTGHNPIAPTSGPSQGSASPGGG